MKFPAIVFLLTNLGASALVRTENPDAPCVPGVTFASLLGAVDVGAADARVHVDRLYALCLPEPKTSGSSNYPYDPDGGEKLVSVIRDANGQSVATYVWRAEKIAGLWELGEYKVLGGYDATKPLGAGNYTLEFAAAGEPFYRFPFSIAVADNDDPYQSPGKRYFIDGPWAEYANVFYQRNDPESSLQFVFWVQDRMTRPAHQTESYDARLVRVRDGKMVAEDHGQMHADRHWQKLEVLFKSAEGDGKAYLKAKEILKEDGAYRVALTRNGKPYGNYAFTVSGGKIQLQGRQIESTDKQTRIVDYVGGGRYRSWWIQRKP